MKRGPLTPTRELGKYQHGGVCVCISNIPDSGLGLFAMEDFKLGDTVCEYGGDIIHSNALGIYPSDYCVSTSFEEYILCGRFCWEQELGLGAYAQHGAEFADQDALGIRVNAEMHSLGTKVYLVACRPIPKVRYCRILM